MTQKVFAKSDSFSQARIKRGFTVNSLGDSLKVDPATLSRIENGKQSTSPVMAKRICRALGTDDFDQLFKIVSS
ncbi:MAG: helix-turn-helix transcriptional regulator [Anaerocolumna sp.]